MIKLPKKASKITKATMKLNGDGTYTLAFKKPFENESVFKKIIDNDVSACLGDDGRVLDSSFEANNITLKTENLRAFQKCMSRRLYFLQRA